MEKAITELVTGYEAGGLTRRGLIRGLTMLFAGTAAAPAAGASASLAAGAAGARDSLHK